MKITISKNHNSIQIRLKPPGYPQYLSKTMGQWGNADDMHAMEGLRLKLSKAIKDGSFTGDISDYLPKVDDVEPLQTLLFNKNKGREGTIESRLIRWLANEPEIYTPAQCKRLFNKKGWQGATLQRYRKAVAAVAPHLVSSIPKGSSSKGEPDPFTIEEVEKLISHFCSTKHGVVIAFWLKTGLRNGELSALTIDDFVKQNDNTHVSVSKSWVNGELHPTPKNKKNRLVPVANEWGEAMISYLSENVEQSLEWKLAYLISKEWKSSLDLLNIRYRKPYCIRHTAISMHLRLYGDIAGTAQMFGTSIAMISKHYGDVVSTVSCL